MSEQGGVVIMQDGNGGSILYSAPDVELHFSWEFAMPPSIALVFGPLDWKHLGATSGERRAAIFHRVASEVVRQRVPGGSYTLDFERGIADILRAG